VSKPGSTPCCFCADDGVECCQEAELPGPPKSVSARVSNKTTLHLTIGKPENDGGAALVRYEVDVRDKYPGQAVGTVQSISTEGARDWEHFVIGDQHFLVVANAHSEEVPGSGSVNYDLDSIIYLYDGTRSSNPFQIFQKIPTKGGADWEHFVIDDQHFLVVANHHSSGSSNQNSIVYKYDLAQSPGPFYSVQSIPTYSARDWEHFVIGDEHFLVVANHLKSHFNNDDERTINSVVYKYDPAQSSSASFQPFQSILTNAATDWEHFIIDDQHYLVVANTGGDSVVYKYNTTLTSAPFQPFQTISTNGATDWEHFIIDGQHFLVVANAGDGGNININSVVYKYDPAQSSNSFQPFQNIPTKAALHWRHFAIAGKHFLVVANHKKSDSDYSTNSVMYRFDSTRACEPFQVHEEIPTHGAYHWEHFVIGEKHFLAVANRRGAGGSTSTTSDVYDRSTFVINANTNGHAVATLTFPSASHVLQEVAAKSCTTTAGCSASVTTSSTAPPCTNAVEKNGFCWLSPCSAGYYGFAPECKIMTNATCSAGMKYSSASAQQETSSLEGALVDDATCDPCSRGLFKSVVGYSACSVCPAGKFTNDTGSANCRLCPAGKNLIEDEAGGASAHDSLSDCSNCPVLKFSPFKGHSEACYPCLTARTEGASSCDGCNPGMFKKSENNTDVCTTCPIGFYSDKQNRERCKECPQGYFANTFVSNDGEVRYDRCESCPRGTHGSRSQAERLESGCTNCTSGKYSEQEAVKEESGCKGCPKGKWSSGVGVKKESRCTNCGTGKYGPNQVGADDQSSCKDCSAGRFLESVGSFGVEVGHSCQSCPSGYSQKKEGQAFCLPCMPVRRIYFGRHNM
jgi:hypothetical protein